MDPGSGSTEPTLSRWDRIDDLLERAGRLPPDAREAFLREECSDDPELYREVRSLLAHADPGQALFDHLGDSLVASGPRGRSEEATPVPESVGPYDIVTVMRDGGMGLVCRGRDRRDGRPVAVKLLPDQRRLEPRSVARFIEEGKVQEAIVHTHVCEVIELGHEESLGPYIVMPFYEGRTLRERLQEGPLPVPRAISIARQIALGLEAAHGHAVIHRDIKPENVILTPDGGLRILDFGAAKQSDVSMTETGKVLGTVTYMSPEQITGDPVTPASDLWSLGVVLHEMLTGRHPFRERSLAATVRRILAGGPDALEAMAIGVPADVWTVSRALLDRDPVRRPDASDTAKRLGGGEEGALGA